MTTFLATEPPASIAELGALFIGFIAWMIRETIPIIKRRWARGRVKKAKAGYEAIGSLLDALEDGRRESGATRALFLVSQNSGGVPSPGVPVKVSIRYESASDNQRRIHSTFQDWLADSPYCDLLRSVSNSGNTPVVIKTAALKPGVLKNLYEADEIIGSKIFLIGHVPDGNWMAYVSFNFQEDAIDSNELTLSPTPAQSEAMRSAVTRMRNILSDSHEVLI